MGQGEFKQDIQQALDNGAILMDVRTYPEYLVRAHARSINVPLHTIDTSNTHLPQDKNAIIVVHCMSGHRSHDAAEKLRELGYKNVLDAGSLASALQYK